MHQNLLMVQRIQSAAKQKYAGRENNRGGGQSAAKLKIMADKMRKIRADWTRKTVLWVSELLILGKRGSTRNGRIRCSNGKVDCKSSRRMLSTRRWRWSTKVG